jgi:hypothetical protein
MEGIISPPTLPASTYKYHEFASHPRIELAEPVPPPSGKFPFAGAIHTSNEPTGRVAEGTLSPDDCQALIHEMREVIRTLKLVPGPCGEAPPVPRDMIQRLRDVDVAFQQMSDEHDSKALPLVQPGIETPRPGHPEQGIRLSPYAGPAPVYGDPGYLGRPFAPYRYRVQQAVSEHPSVQHVMDMLQSSALVVNPNASNRTVGDNKTPDDTPIPRATPVRLNHFSNPDQGLTPSGAYFCSRFLAPERHERGPQGLGPYHVHRAEQLFLGPASGQEDGPLWLGADQVRAVRDPGPSSQVQAAAPRARRSHGTDRTNYTRRRAPNKIPRLAADTAADNTQTTPVTVGPGRGRRGGNGRGRPRGRPRLQR